jgi:hypothetical protein
MAVEKALTRLWLNLEKGIRLTTKKCRYRSKATAKKFGINFAVLARSVNNGKEEKKF